MESSYLYLQSGIDRRWLRFGTRYLSHFLCLPVGVSTYTAQLQLTRLRLIGAPQANSASLTPDFKTLTSGLHFRRSQRTAGIIQRRLAGGGHSDMAETDELGSTQ